MEKNEINQLDDVILTSSAATRVNAILKGEKKKELHLEFP